MEREKRETKVTFFEDGTGLIRNDTMAYTSIIHLHMTSTMM